jgi:hypothetical protein
MPSGNGRARLVFLFDSDMLPCANGWNDLDWMNRSLGTAPVDRESADTKNHLPAPVPRHVRQGITADVVMLHLRSCYVSKAAIFTG